MSNTRFNNEQYSSIWKIVLIKYPKYCFIYDTVKLPILGPSNPKCPTDSLRTKAGLQWGDRYSWITRVALQLLMPLLLVTPSYQQSYHRVIWYIPVSLHRKLSMSGNDIMTVRCCYTSKKISMMLTAECSDQTKPMPYLLITWRLCMIDGSLYPMGNDFNYLCHLSTEKWYKSKCIFIVPKKISAWQWLPLP